MAIPKLREQSAVSVVWSLTIMIFITIKVMMMTTMIMIMMVMMISFMIVILMLINSLAIQHLGFHLLWYIDPIGSAIPENHHRHQSVQV